MRETKRCRQIIRELLDFARPTPPARKPTDINEVVRRALAVVANQLTESKVGLDLYLDSDLPEANAQGNQIQQVLVNLLINAADAIGPEGGRIRVVTGVAQVMPVGEEAIHWDSGARPMVEIRVEDTGCGIAPEESRTFTNPSSPARAPRHRPGPGRLLGHHREPRRHHRRPERTGQGTRFTVRLPLAPGAAGGPGPSRPSQPLS